MGLALFCSFPPPFFLVLFEDHFLYCPMQMPFSQYCGEVVYFFGNLYIMKKADCCTRCLDKILQVFACAIKLLFLTIHKYNSRCGQYTPISVALLYKARVFTIWWSEVTNHILLIECADLQLTSFIVELKTPFRGANVIQTNPTFALLCFSLLSFLYLICLPVTSVPTPKSRVSGFYCLCSGVTL